MEDMRKILNICTEKPQRHHFHSHVVLLYVENPEYILHCNLFAYFTYFYKIESKYQSISWMGSRPKFLTHMGASRDFLG